MSDTRTDDIETAKEWARNVIDPDGEGWRPTIGRLARRVEELERENAALRAELDSERTLPTHLLDVHAICDQRDKARQDRDRYRDIAERLVDHGQPFCLTETEWDQAKLDLLEITSRFTSKPSLEIPKA